MKNILIKISDKELDLPTIHSFLTTPRVGGIDIFIGTTRQWTNEKETTLLEYECYPEMAKKVIKEIIGQALSKWSLERVCVFHRTGIVPVAEASVMIGVGAAHRDAAFAGCRFLIDTLKEQVPIWKKENYADGTMEWIQGSVPPA